jgi:ABC-type transport system substrate-binding protein
VGAQEGPYPLSIAKAKALLSSHGWTVNPGGVTTCADPARCGATFSLGYLPTGDVYYYSGAAANSGGYSNAENWYFVK